VNGIDARILAPLAPHQPRHVMLHTHWSGEQWSVVMIEFRKAVTLRGQIRRAGWFN